MRSVNLLGTVLLALIVAGCSAAHYRRTADRDVYSIIQQTEVQIFGRTNTFTIDTPYSGRKPSNILPGNLEQFSSAGSRVDTQQIDQFQPRQINEVLVRVPGVNVINDDGFGRHGGIGMRGSPPRRGRKILTLEDGQPINMSVWIDPSVHYVPPIDRLDSVEVLRGTFE